jgi:hypothetical protein
VSECSLSRDVSADSWRALVGLNECPKLFGAGQPQVISRSNVPTRKGAERRLLVCAKRGGAALVGDPGHVCGSDSVAESRKTSEGGCDCGNTVVPRKPALAVIVALSGIMG